MPGHLIHFADVVIDPSTRELNRGGEAVPVQRKVFELLLYLVEHRERAVGKDELQDAVWPGVIVTETALTRAVMKARRAVGDDSERQWAIRTVHGHGYRFVAELSAEAPAADTPDGAAPAARLRLRGRRGWSVVGAVLLLGLVAAAALFAFRPVSSASVRVAMLPVADRTGDPDLAWTGLGLMSYANRLFAEGTRGESVPARRVMSAAESLPEDPSPEKLEELRGALGASHLVWASLRRDGEGLALDYRVFHGAGAGPPATIAGNDPTLMVRQMARAVISSLPGAGLRRSFRTVSKDPFVNEAYARGLALQLEGDAAKARDYFEVAVRQEPGLFWPRYELALTLRDAGDLDGALRELALLAARKDVKADPEMRAAASNALALVHWRRGEYVEADRAYGRALEAARAAGKPFNEAIVLTNRGILARITGDLEGARAHLAAALEAMERSETPEPGSIYHSLGQVEWVAGRLPLAMDYYRRAYDAFQAEDDQRSLASALNSMARVESRLGRYGEAEKHMLDALGKREELGDFFGRVHSHVALAELYRDTERPDEARGQADQAVALAGTAEHFTGFADALRTRAGILLDAGDVTSARADLDHVRQSFPDDAGGPAMRLLEARLAFADGDPARGGDLLAGIVREGPDAMRIEALDVLAVQAADLGQARAYWQRALDLARQNQERGRAGRLLLAMARRELQDGDLAEARTRAEELAGEFGDWAQVQDLRQRLTERL